MRRRVALLLVAVVLGGVLPVAAPTPPSADAASAVTGAGSTFAQIAIDQWRADAARKYGIEVNYSGQGSSSGRRQFIEGTVDWASSDIPFEPDELGFSRKFAYMPLVAGGTALMYNLTDPGGARITNLQLSGPTIAKIFTGEIRRWNDPAIQADNPSIKGRLPAQDIRPVVRSGGSGTTAVFTGYFAALAPSVWNSFASKYGLQYDFTSTFPDVPGFIKQSGSDGIANFVANPNAGKGSIGYAEAGYALQRGLTMASVKNEAGSFTQPTPRNVAIALTQATRNPDGTQNLDDVYFHTDPSTYPISSYNYAIVETNGGDPAVGEALGRFLIHSITEGQAKAAPLGYSPLPPNLVQQGLDVIKSIPGAPTPPPLGDWGKYYLQLEVPGGQVTPTTQPGSATTAPPTTVANTVPGATVPGGAPAPGTPGAPTLDPAAGPGGAAAGQGAGGSSAGGDGDDGGSGGSGSGSDGGGGAGGEDGDGGEDESSDSDGEGAVVGIDEELLAAAVDQQAVGYWGYDEAGNPTFFGADGDEQPFDAPADGPSWVLIVAGIALLTLVFVPPTVGAVARRRQRRHDEVDAEWQAWQDADGNPDAATALAQDDATPLDTRDGLPQRVGTSP